MGKVAGTNFPLSGHRTIDLCRIEVSGRMQGERGESSKKRQALPASQEQLAVKQQERIKRQAHYDRKRATLSGNPLPASFVTIAVYILISFTLVS